EHNHDHLTGVRGRVSPGFGEGLKPCTCCANRFHRLQEISGRTRQTIQPPDDDNVAFAELVQHPLQLRPMTAGSGRLLPEEFLAARFLQSVELEIEPTRAGSSTFWRNCGISATRFWWWSTMRT